MRSTFVRVALSCLLSCVVTAAAGANWLALRDGARVETAGGWEVKGKVVIFKLADGALSSLRLAEVDLEASERATAEAARKREEADRPAPSPPAKRATVLILTDDDVPRAADDAADAGDAAGATAGGAAGGEAAADAPEAPVAVVSWDQEVDGRGARITGRVSNRSEAVAVDVAVTVHIYDDGGGLLGRAAAIVEQTFLAPGESSGFRAFFTEVASVASAAFGVTSARFVASGELSAPRAPEPEN